MDNRGFYFNFANANRMAIRKNDAIANKSEFFF